MTVHISKMTGKLEGFQAISTNTMSNPYCIKQNTSGKADNICTKCYSHTMLKSYRKNMQPSLQRNTEYLSNKVHDPEYLHVINQAWLRFNAHGELINLTHLENLNRIARKNPHCTFALWTKRNDLIKKYYDKREKPINLILIFSNPKVSTIMSKPPKHFDKTFNNVLEHEYQDKQNCTGQKCKDCRICYTIGNQINTIVEKVKKY